MTEWNKRTGISPEELRQTLESACDALSEVARTKGLDPDGERAREMCSDALRKLNSSRRHRRSH